MARLAVACRISEGGESGGRPSGHRQQPPAGWRERALIGDGGFDLGARTHQVRDDLAAGPKTDVKKVYAIGLDDRAVFLTAWRERAIAALDAKAVAGNASAGGAQAAEG
jgi:hypothetical protein